MIRENNSQDNRALADALRKQHPEILRNTDANEGASSKKTIVKRVAVFATLAAAVTAAVLIPTLLLNTGDATSNPDYVYSPTPLPVYKTTELNYTVQEYNDLYNTSFLYFDFSDDYTVTKYSYTDSENFLGLGVSLKNTETNDDIEYVICSDTKTLDFLEYNIFICDNESTVSDTKIKWATVNNNSYGIFNFDGYGYYITLKNNPDETRLFELIQILLPAYMQKIA